MVLDFIEILKVIFLGIKRNNFLCGGAAESIVPQRF